MTECNLDHPAAESKIMAKGLRECEHLLNLTTHLKSMILGEMVHSKPNQVTISAGATTPAQKTKPSKGKEVPPLV